MTLLMVLRLKMDLKLDGSAMSSPHFFVSGVTCAVLNLCENVEWANDKFANRAMMLANVPLHDLMSDVVMKSSGDDCEGIDFGRRTTLASATGVNTASLKIRGQRIEVVPYQHR
jgi:hypothetical protein